MSELRFETLQIHAGATPDPTTNAVVTPIYQTTSYVFDSAEHAANLFALKDSGNIYSRMMNPTTAVLEERIAALEGGSGALAVSSGQAAETLAVMNILGAGDHIVSSAAIYGGTANLFQYTLGRLGIEVTFITAHNDPEAWRQAVRPNTRLFYAESIGNPAGNILDVETVAAVAHEHGVPLMVDNTVASPYLSRPLDHGADIVVHSATKFLSGHGSVVAGVIVDGGTFPWSEHSDHFPGLTKPDPSYGGIVYSEAIGNETAYITKARVQLLRDVGASLAPASAWQVLQGVETLSLRMERHVENTTYVAEWLEAHDDVISVSYAGLASSPWRELAGRYAPRGAGAILAFELKGGQPAGRKFVESVKLFKHLVNIGDVRSLACHPSSTTHAQLSPEEQIAAGISPGLVRLSVGLEHRDDLIEDLDQAIRAAVHG